MNEPIPQQALDALAIAQAQLANSIEGVYLFGSAVVGGLRVNSDVDVLMIIDRPLTSQEREALVASLMYVSGKIDNDAGLRPLEFTVLNRATIMPWRYPPASELVYGGWLREAFERNRIPEPEPDPDLAIVLTQVRQNSLALVGPEAHQLLDPIPHADIARALHESLPQLIDGLVGDERNVLLTLARMWRTAETGDIVPKDVAAGWAVDRLPESLSATLALAKRGYLGEVRDSWVNRQDEVESLVNVMRDRIEGLLR